MRRKVFRFAAALSLVLCVAMATLWGRSYTAQEHLGWRTQAGARELHSSAGKFALYFDSAVAARPDRPIGFTYLRYAPTELDYQAYSPLLELGGFALARHDAGAMTWCVLVVPAWAIVAFLAVLPSVWALRFHAARGSRGLSVCARCGYDLRATAGRCPECGTVPAARPAAAA